MRWCAEASMWLTAWRRRDYASAFACAGRISSVSLGLEHQARRVWRAASRRGHGRERIDGGQRNRMNLVRKESLCRPRSGHLAPELEQVCAPPLPSPFDFDGDSKKPPRPHPWRLSSRRMSRASPTESRRVPKPVLSSILHSGARPRPTYLVWAGRLD